MEKSTAPGGKALYPLVFEPLYKSYIWGGKNLDKFGKSLPDANVAESWEISAHPQGLGIVANGPYEGKSLIDLVEELGQDLLGSLSTQKYGMVFPLLIKLIDANDWLSVQVHPGDEYARIHENDFGKTEMWYVLEAEPGAKIIYGLADTYNKESYARLIAEGRIGESLAYSEVKTGDVVYLPAGKVHAAGKGILIAEVQQNSNATYRLYDYDRKNPDGTTRPLHIEKALDVIHFQEDASAGFCEGLSYDASPELSVKVIIADPHFCAEVLTLKGTAKIASDTRSFKTLTLLKGSAQLHWENGTLSLKAGQSLLLPAGLGEIALEGDALFLKSYVEDLETDVLLPLNKAGYELEEIRTRVGGIV